MADSEMIKIWVTSMIENEIEDTEGTIENEELWMLGSSDPEEAEMHEQNIVNLNEYLCVLRSMLEEVM